MSGKLDQSLDEITTSQRRAGGRQRRRTSTRAAPVPTAPAGGIKKTTKGARNAPTKATPAQGATSKGDSKVIVSNLPKDVTEQQIKEYFVQSVGPIKKVELSYGPNSQSRGIANVLFREADGASKAFQKLNGLLVDGRPIKIEIVVSAGQADKFIPPPKKTLAERTTQPKSQPKSAAADKKGVAGKAAAKPAKKGRGRSARPAKKTAAELDSEMADYFDAAPNNENAAAAPAAAPAPANESAPAGNGEAMDEIE